ncbi:MAG: BamA/TamA family outer membrane protein [Chitinophagaceae bacterium]
MKYLLSLFFIIGVMASGFGQDSIWYRLIFIGDNEADQYAPANIISGKTSVIYLDESNYLRGKLYPGGKEEKAAQQQLQAQYQQMRSKGAVVYFIPGNHTWNKTGSEEIERIKRQQKFLEGQGDSLVRFIAGGRCPDPIPINITDSSMIIVFNSEWWLFPYNNANPENECECKTRSEVLARLDELRYKNRHKLILLTSHHPFQSYGMHDGRLTLKDHLFPLTSINKNLYIPLPGIGSVYSFFRSAFSSPNDAKHPLHKDMVKKVDDIFNGFPNIVHIAGHEQGLQFIKDKQIQVISGAGDRHIKAKKTKHSLFADNRPGYVTIDILTGNKMQLSFYSTSKNKTQQAFTYQLPYTPAGEEYALADTAITTDSTTVQIHPAYEEPGKLHRFLFGENYRKEWAAPTRLPVIRLSKFQGGLKPLQRGGGMQSQSLRLEDKDGKEWVIRSVEKSPDALLPGEFRQTFARDLLDDATSAQHPFSAMIVPPIANAVKVPHAVPVIGVIAPDKNLGIYGRTFLNMVVLLEEREPLGESDNTLKMKKNLRDDNDNRIDAKEFLNARMLDMLLGDWDRHEDQWRWKDRSKGKSKNYLGVPRDRDQVFHLTQGLVPKFASRDYILPTLRNFDPDINQVKWVIFKTRFVNAYPEFQINREEWKTQAEQFKLAITDSVIETALKRLPQSSYDLRHDVLYKKLQSRRDRIPAAMDQYYQFIQKVVDIQTSDKNEWVQIRDAPGGGMNIRISKISKDGKIDEELMNKTYDPALTKEIRLYVRNGQDSIVLNNKESKIKLRIIGGNDKKAYNIIASKNKVDVYDKLNESVFWGDVSKTKKYISNDSLNTAFVPVNLYNVWMPLTVIGLNQDDGFIFGAGFKFIKQEGFRKFPYASVQQLQAGYSFSTGAYRIRYNGDWIHTFGKADFTLQAFARAPNNTINFFGRGNETVYEKTGDFKKYYRTRYSTYQLDPALRWRRSNGSSFSIGPSLYAYFFDKEENKGRFISNTSLIGSYDSLTIEKDKWHIGAVANYTRDKRSNKIFPQWGSYINIRLQAYKGIGDFSKSFAQLIPELAFYKSLNKKSTIILAERMGGVVGVGNAAFYQSAFIGGQENLLGYRQYRFAGQHSFYNNMELRIKLADIASYIIPGQFGITGFWDAGRVWEKHDNSGKWHQGVGGGIYFAPASVIALSFVVGHSSEGFYPYFTMGLRF